ncbi:drug/metabolite transporter (DMT)-like permease [Streptomyces sp. V3I8]|uniref:EamA family transporter n=1 Tax=Streptomyces sp. V3I8 TaxID=3042279 RepID=UPI00278705C7|nr:EamA family transporter [Streptomyces sp. V3I8]MDQ1040876.1 drug/metabolite transporter (DMT)-like permease [Streptomyces sp. V3I8]
MGALLALASAVCYGVVDFAGGLLSRRTHYAVVSFLGQVGGLLLALVVAAVVPADAVRSADVLWGALSGVGSGAAMLFLNRGLSRGAMSVVVPVSAVTGVVLSVLCGVWFLGDRPSVPAWLGICVTVPALWCVSRGGGRGTDTGRAAADGLPASLGVAVQYIGLAQAGAGSGMWPVAAGRVAAVVLLLPSAWRWLSGVRQPAGPLARPRGLCVRPKGLCVRAMAVGAGAALALALYLAAAHRQMLALAVVLASLYPAIPTVLGLTLLNEKVNRRQTAGLLAAAGAVVLLTLG